MSSCASRSTSCLRSAPCTCITRRRQPPWRLAPLPCAGRSATAVSCSPRWSRRPRGAGDDHARGSRRRGAEVACPCFPETLAGRDVQSDAKTGGAPGPPRSGGVRAGLERDPRRRTNGDAPMVFVSGKPTNPIVLVGLIVMAIHVLHAGRQRATLPGAEASMTTTSECLTAFCWQGDAHLTGLPTPPEAHLWPREVVPLGLWHALTGVGHRPFSRWLTRNSRPVLPPLPERTRLLRCLRPLRTGRGLAWPPRPCAG